MARRLELSLGKTNYCVRAVVKKGWVKVQNFRSSSRKSAYMYMLTPKGVAAKGRITKRFLDRKVEEYERLQKEIQQFRAEVEGPGPLGAGAVGGRSTGRIPSGRGGPSDSERGFL